MRAKLNIRLAVKLWQFWRFYGIRFFVEYIIQYYLGRSLLQIIEFGCLILYLIFWASWIDAILRFRLTILVSHQIFVFNSNDTLVAICLNSFRGLLSFWFNVFFRWIQFFDIDPYNSLFRTYLLPSQSSLRPLVCDLVVEAKPVA